MIMMYYVTLDCFNSNMHSSSCPRGSRAGSPRLWSRLFFPLLPLGEPTTTAIAAGDEALQRKLCNAGLSKKAG